MSCASMQGIARVAMTSTRFVSFEDLRAFGIKSCKVTLWRLERTGKFPRRVQVSPGRVAWVEAEIRQYMADCMAARDSMPVEAA